MWASGGACSEAVVGEACPAGAQEIIDAMYSSCADDPNAEAGNWEKYADGEIKEAAEECGCHRPVKVKTVTVSDAAQSAPVVFVLMLAAAANHFLN